VLKDTAARLEAALANVCAFDYVEERVSGSLYWGALHTDVLGFPPMGKGASSLQCRVSTLAEAAEWLALRRRRELPGHLRAHQDDVHNPLCIEAFLVHIASATPEFLVDIKDTEPARHWVDGFSLTEECDVSVPLEYVNGISGTNGVAAGNCIEEAIVQGICEVFERRAAVTAVRNRMVLPTINTETIEDAVLREQIAFLRDQGVDVFVKDLSFGGALPCVGAYFINHAVDDRYQAHHVFKAAASYDRVAALRSCLTEYAQVCQLGRHGPQDDKAYERLLCRGDEADNFLPLFWFGYVPFGTAGFLTQGNVVPFDAGERLGDCLEDIERAKALCCQLGLDLVVVDLTDPAVGFPVVQVVVPGYSDILPYHPPSSPVLLNGWTRDLPMGNCREGDAVVPCTAEALFPAW